MLLPLIALIRYQVVPDFAPGQFALQCEPLTVATTVTLAFVASRVLIADVVDAFVRTFTPEHAGTIVVEVGEGVVADTGRDGGRAAIGEQAGEVGPAAALRRRAADALV